MASSAELSLALILIILSTQPTNPPALDKVVYGLPAALGVVGGLQGLAKGSISGSLGLLRVGGTSDMGSGGSLRGGRFYVPIQI